MSIPKYTNAREEQDTMSQTAAQGKQVKISSSWFRSGYSHGIKDVLSHRLPSEPTESAVIDVFKRVLDIYCDDNGISDEQLRYEAGRLVAYLVATTG